VKAVPMARIFAMPIVIAVISIVGLVGALLGDGWLDVISWAGLLVPLAVIAWALRYRRL
jgi:hypothetical protein